MTKSLSCSETTNSHSNLAEKKHELPKRITVNVSLCGSIPRSAIPALHPQHAAPGNKNRGLSINKNNLTVTNGSNVQLLRIPKGESRLPVQVPNSNGNPADECTSPTNGITSVTQLPVVVKPKLPATIAPPSGNSPGVCRIQDENVVSMGNNKKTATKPNSTSSTETMRTDHQQRRFSAPYRLGDNSRAQYQSPTISLQPRLRLGGNPRLNAGNESRCATNTLDRPESSTAPKQQDPVPASQPSMEPPPWAVRAKGHAKLEPVCDTAKTHQAVDLTTKSHFRIGRSPASDVQLLHATSSRRHAMLFHHPNGSCYVVDCGSAHGTYVNGVRVQSTLSSGHNSSCDSSGNKSVVVPHRVRRGALIRFGGPGAPSFVLKSFSVDMKDIVGRATNATRCKLEETPSCSPTLAPTLPTRSRAEPEPITQSLSEPQKKTSQSLNKACDSGALVLLNTRLNAIGGACALAPEARKLAQGALTKLSADFYAELKQQRVLGQFSDGSKKRARQAGGAMASKRRKSSLSCPSSPVLSLDRPHPCLVSPCPTFGKRLQHPAFPPSAYTLTPAQQTFSLNDLWRQDCGRAPSPPILTLSSTPGAMRSTKQRRVEFSDEQPDCVYPHPVTPDDLSSDENKDDESVNSDDSNAALGHDAMVIALPTPPTTPRVVALGS